MTRKISHHRRTRKQRALLTATVPEPFGASVIAPLAPSVIVMLPVVELPVFKVKSKSPLD